MRRTALLGSALTLLVWWLLAGCSQQPTTTMASVVDTPMSSPERTEATETADGEPIRIKEASLELDATLPEDPAVIKGRLANGLTYFIRENRRPENRAELRLVVNAGSILEDEDQLGLAHFLEHMAFNGTAHFKKQELVDYLQSVGMRFGADINAYTSFDETVYQLQVPTDDEQIVKDGFLILEDWAHGIALEAEEIDKERGVVIEEWRLDRGAGARVRDQQLPILFKDSRYAERLPIGKKEVLESFEHDTLRRFYRDWYRPELMAVVGVGDFDAARIEALIKTHFNRLKAPKSPRERFLAEVVDQEETLYSLVSDAELSGTSVTIAYRYDLEPEGKVADYRRGLVESLFHSMLNARLAERAQEAEPPFLSAFSSQGNFVRTKGFYTLGAGVDEDGLLRGLEAILTEAERARRYGFNESELERQRVLRLRSYERAFEERNKTDSRVYTSEYIRVFLEGESFPGIAFEKALAETYLPTVTVAETNALAKKWISDRNRVILVQAPEKEGLELPTQAQLGAVFEGVVGAEIEPYVDQLTDRPLVAQVPSPGRIVDRSEDRALGVSEWQLANGVRVLLKPTDFKNDEVVFNAWSPGGHSLVSEEDYVAGSMAAGVVGRGGLGEFDLVALSKHLAGKVAGVRPDIDELSEGLSGGGSPQDLKTLFELIYLRFTAPRKDEQAFLSFQSRLRSSVRNRRAIPEVVFSEVLTATLSQDHSRRRPLDEEFVDEMDLERSFAIYRDRFADAGDFTFLFVGSFDLEEIEPLVVTYLGSLPTAGREESWRDVGVRAPEGVVKKEVAKGLEPKSRYSLVFTGPFEQSPERRHVLQSLAELLRERLRVTLREDMGGTYGVSVRQATSHYPRQEYDFSVGFSCDPENLATLRGAVFEEIEKIKSELPTAAELQTIKEKQLRARETALQSNGFWLSALRSAYYFDEDPKQILALGERVEALDGTAIRAAAKRTLNLERYVEVTLVPEEAPSAAAETVGL